ncbi:MAG: hypothetical protein IJT18_03735 [Oscillospiraceae bacterium]|nr:hypothetical protein [Oscillospiraceae bacterium]
MRRYAAALSILLCILLCGCSAEQNAVQPALDFRTKLLAAGGCTFSADFRADYGDKLFDFSADCVYDGKNGTVTVTKPDTISGIAASANDDSAALSFDGVTLALDDLGEGRVPPLSAAWLFGSAWRSDFISAGGDDGGRYRVTILRGYDEDELQIDTWFDGGVPVSGEIAYKGQRVLSADFSDFSFLQQE